MAKIIELTSENPSYDKKTSEDLGSQVSITLAQGFEGPGFVSGLEEGDNIYFANSHLLRNWRDGVQNTLSIEHDLRTINITDYFGGETAYPAITLNSNPLPNDLTVKIANDDVFTTPYSCDPNFNEIITGIGYVENLGEGDRISCLTSPEYYFNSEGLGVQDDENDIVIADNTTGQTDKVYVGTSQDDISEKTLTVTERSSFDATGLGYLNYDITGTNDNDTYTGGAGNDTINSGAGADTITTGTGADIVDAGAGDDTIIVDGEGIKTLSGGEGENIFYVKSGSAIITDAKAGDKIKFESLDVTNIEFTKGIGARAQDLIISSNIEGEDGSVVIRNYFNDDGSVAENHINTFIIDDKTYTLDYLQDINGEYHLYTVIEGTDEADNIESVDDMQNWIKGKGANDTISGADEDDVIEGNAGDDILTGGEGNDTFVFNPGDGHDTITGAHAGDIIKFGKGSADFSDDMFARSTVEGHTDDLIITYSPAEWANTDTVTIENYFSEAAGLRLSTYVTSDGEIHEFIASDAEITPEDIQNNDGKIVINKDVAGEIKVDASEYVSPSTKGLVISNMSPDVVLDVTGSYYDDVIRTSKSTGDNTIVESYGTNRVITGKGNDYVLTEKDSHNRINVGSGDNIVLLDNVGTNRVFAGKGNDTVSVTNCSSNRINVGGGNNVVLLDSVSTNRVIAGNANNTITANSGINTVILGKGDNEVAIAGGVNTVKTAAGNNFMTIGDGVNKIITDKGDDEFIIDGGNNTFNSGASKTPVNQYVGGDRYYINGGNNKIVTTGATYVSVIDSSTNKITTGDMNDVFKIAGGINNIKGGAGNDNYIFSSLTEDNKTVITDSKGNDTYDFSEINSEDFDGVVTITDKDGLDTIKLANDELKLFFDGTFKYNKSKGTGTFTSGKNVIFAEELTPAVTSGIQISGKAVEDLSIECVNGSYNIDSLKNEITKWFVANNTYGSVDAVLSGNNQEDIASLLAVYNTGTYTPPNV